MISQKESVIISHSPVRKLGSLTVGPLFVKKDFDWLWDADNTPAAALFSGTLSYDIAGKVSYEFMRSKLCIPKERLSVTTPIYSKWSYSIPILHIPSLESAPDLAYPKNAEEADENDPSKIDPRLLVWWDAVAARLSTIGRKAKGGTLILCNSYRDIKELSDRLHGRVAADRLVLHQPGKSISQLRGVFIEKFESGVLPFWLASGPAWTGLDMRAGDEDPAKDFLLTDLVIVRIPYGMNRTSTHIAREAWNPNADFKGKEAILRLKQGLGRLMRQDGVTDRHIWFLDGRIKINGYDAKNCRILGKYIHVESF